VKVISPFIIAFLASRFVIFAWAEKLGFQSAFFSPTMASILSAPIIAAIYFCLLNVDIIQNTVEGNLTLLALGALLFSPTLIVLSPLLAIYLFRASRQKPTSNLLLSTAAIFCLALQFMWAIFLLDERHDFW
jgi:hypothetical protein